MGRPRYYSAGPQFVESCQRIAAAGEFPRDLDSIRDLPGVGGYTAAAVGSIAFDIPVGVLDGNVARVLARLRESTKTSNCRRSGKSWSESRTSSRMATGRATTIRP